MKNQKCPNCYSRNINTNISKKPFLGYILAIFIYSVGSEKANGDTAYWLISIALCIIVILFFHIKSFSSNYCNNCENKF